MKKLNRKLIAGTAMIATAAALAACGNNNINNEGVYGPPNDTVYGPPTGIGLETVTFEDIDVGPEEDVYGPPEYFEETEADDSLTEPEEGVYGPPVLP